MKPTLLLLTNFTHGSLHELEEEDIFLAEYLRKHFRVMVSHPLDCEKVEDNVDCILMRNIWPVFEYQNEWENVKKRFMKKGLVVYNPLSAQGDMVGKDHVLELFNAGYPVIPTVDKVSHIETLQAAGDYFIKPKVGCDAIGAKRVSQKELQKLRGKLRDYVIQPYIDFVYEVSFYVLDGKIIHAFSTPKKVSPYTTQAYTPSKEDILFVKTFVQWNDLPFGLQRVDACRTKEGELLLVELEDFCPYLNLLSLDEKKRSAFLKALVLSLKKFVARENRS